MERITLKDIAQKTGYSASTVSRVLAGSARISAPTRRKILAVAEKCGYRTTCRNIAVILPSPILNNYYGWMCSSISYELMQRSFNPVLIQMEQLDVINDIPICGAISILSENMLARVWGKIHQWPLICMNTMSNRLENIYRVSANEKQGMELIVNQLAAAGHTRIARLGGSYTFNMPGNWSSILRNEAFNHLADRFCLTKDLKIITKSTLEDLLDTLPAVLEQKPTALIIQTEDFLLPVLHALRLLKVKIPEDLSLAAWSYHSVQSHTQPAVCGVMQDYDRMARMSCEMLQRLSNGESIDDIEVDYISLSGSSIAEVPHKDSPLSVL